MVALLYFDSIDLGSLGKAFNISADQALQDIISQNDLISSNLIECMKSIKLMNQSIIDEIRKAFNRICAKMNVVF